MDNPRRSKLALIHWLLIVVIAALLANAILQVISIRQRGSWLRPRSSGQTVDPKEVWRKEAMRIIESELSLDSEHPGTEQEIEERAKKVKELIRQANENESFTRKRRHDERR